MSDRSYQDGFEAGARATCIAMQAELVGLRTKITDLKRQLKETRKDTERLRNLCERSYAHLLYWFGSLKGDALRLWQDLHKELHMQPKREAIGAAAEGKERG